MMLPLPCFFRTSKLAVNLESRDELTWWTEQCPAFFFFFNLLLFFFFFELVHGIACTFACARPQRPSPGKLSEPISMIPFWAIVFFPPLPSNTNCEPLLSNPGGMTNVAMRNAEERSDNLTMEGRQEGVRIVFVVWMYVIEATLSLPRLRGPLTRSHQGCHCGGYSGVSPA